MCLPFGGRGAGFHPSGPVDLKKLRTTMSSVGLGEKATSEDRSEVTSKAEFSGIPEKVLVVVVIMNHDGRFLQLLKAKTALTFNQAFHYTCF